MRSKFERDFANSLTVPFTYESDSFDYIAEHTYTPDFVFIKKNGEKMYIETKGFFDPDARKKTLLILKQHANIDLRLVFQNANNKINKKSKTTYGKWADKHDILWASKRMPEDWLAEIAN